jgi:hypothetical protein
MYRRCDDGKRLSTKLRIIYVTNVEASVANDVAKIAECAYNMKLEYWKGRTSNRSTDPSSNEG